MPSQIKNAIDELRRVRELVAEGETDELYQKMIETLEADICRYRSDDKFTVFLVVGLHEYDTHYESLDAVDWALGDWDAGELLDDGIPITIELKRMTGRELGRLEAYED